jgi:hypothetical protein
MEFLFLASYQTNMATNLLLSTLLLPAILLSTAAAPGPEASGPSLPTKTNVFEEREEGSLDSLPRRSEEPLPRIQYDYSLGAGENARQKATANLFIRVKLDKASCYENEMIHATWLLYSRVVDSTIVRHVPKLNGFFTHSMDPAGSRLENINGRPFIARVLRRAQLVPQQSGALAIDPLIASSVVTFIPGRSTAGEQTTLDGLTAAVNEEEKRPVIREAIQISSDALSLRVNPQPGRADEAPLPVGSFTIEGRLGRTNMAAGEANTLEITVRGRGYLSATDTLAVQWPMGTSLINTELSEEIDPALGYAAVVNHHRFTFSADATGKFVLPAVRFHYLDPVSGTNQTIETREWTLNVTPQLKQPATAEKTDAKDLGGGRQIGFTLLAIALAILLLLALRWRRRKIPELKASPDPEIASDEVAPIIDPSWIDQARTHLQNQNHSAYLQLLSECITKAVAQHFQVTAPALSPTKTVELLRIKGMPLRLAEGAGQILSEWEMARYAPPVDHGDINHYLPLAGAIIEYLEQLPKPVQQASTEP